MALGRVRRCGTRLWRNRMTAKRIIVLCAAIVVLCIALGSLSDDVYAQRDSAFAEGGGKDLIQRTGLATGNPNEGKGVPPTKVQMAIGVGSFIIMIIVLKWL